MRWMIALASVTLCACTASMKVHVDIADPAPVEAARSGSKSQLICSSILRREDARAMANAAKAVEDVSNACVEYLTAEADRLVDPAQVEARNLKLDEIDAFAAIYSDDVYPLVDAIDARRNELTADLLAAGAGLPNACDIAPQFAMRLIDYDAERRQLVEELGTFEGQASRHCAQSRTVTVEADQAEQQISVARSVIGGGSLVASDYAFAVASLPTLHWRRFNEANGISAGGNLDVAIKMNEPGDFTIKGMRFDATKVAQIVGKTFVQMLLLSAGQVGVASGVAQSSGEHSVSVAPHAGLAGQQALERRRQAVLESYRRAAAELALQIVGESSNFDTNRDQATDAVQAAVQAHAPRLTLQDLPEAE